MFGKDLPADQVNFEWPTQEMLRKMPHDVSIKEITFKRGGVDGISSVRCTLTND